MTKKRFLWAIAAFEASLIVLDMYVLWRDRAGKGLL